MNSTEKSRTVTLIGAVGYVGTFLIMAAMIWIMYYYTLPPAVDRARKAERLKNLADLRATTDEQLKNYGWIDVNKGVLRVPIKRAMELAAQEGNNPALARSNLIARMEKAAPPAVTNSAASQATNAVTAPQKPKP